MCAAKDCESSGWAQGQVQFNEIEEITLDAWRRWIGQPGSRTGANLSEWLVSLGVAHDGGNGTGRELCADRDANFAEAVS